MAKPTLLQTLLNKPSQSYMFPAENDYHSTRQHMRRIATEAASHPPEASMHHKQLPSSLSSSSPLPTTTSKDIKLDIRNDEKELFDIKSNDDNVDNNVDDDNSSSSSDKFYTPNSSPRTSMPPITARIDAAHSTRTPRDRDTDRDRVQSVSSMSSASLDAHSLFSDLPSDSTPRTSDAGHHHHAVAATTVFRSYAYTDEDWAKDVRWLVQPTSDGNDKGKHRQLTRNLSKATTTPYPMPIKQPHQQARSSQRRQGEPHAGHSGPLSSHLNPQKTKTASKPLTDHRKPLVDHRQGSIMMSMSALLEEDEPDLPDARPRRLSTPQNYSERNRDMNHSGLASDRIPRTSRPNLTHRRSRSLDAPRSPSRSSGHTPSNSQSVVTPRTFAAEAQALPLPSGALPSSGTPGFTSLVLPRAPATANANGTGNGNVHTNMADGKIDLTRSGIAQTTMASVEVVRGLGGRGGFGFGIFNLWRRRTVPLNAEHKNPSMFSSTRTADTPSMLGFTSHRTPPAYVPSGSVLVQVWAVGVDGLDARLAGVRMGCAGSSGGGPGGGRMSTEQAGGRISTDQAGGRMNADQGGGERGRGQTSVDQQDLNATSGKKGIGLGRSVSLKARLGRVGSLGRKDTTQMDPSGQPQQPVPQPEHRHLPDIGFIPGRSFVGRVLEVGWDVREATARKGEWVVGLLDLKKCGALTEFVVVDRHRVHRVPYPHMGPSGLKLSPGEDDTGLPEDWYVVDANDRRPQDSRSGNEPGARYGNDVETRRPSSSRQNSGSSAQPSLRHASESIARRPSESGSTARRPSESGARRPSGDSTARHYSNPVGQSPTDSHPRRPSNSVSRRPSDPVGRHPSTSNSTSRRPSTSRHPSASSNTTTKPAPQSPPPLTLEELALLPLCGVPAYRAVRTFLFAFSSQRDMPFNSQELFNSAPDRRGVEFGSVDPEAQRDHDGSMPSGLQLNRNPSTANSNSGSNATRRRVLVLRGHDGVGAMAVQMLVRRGWRVCAHVPFAASYRSSPAGVTGKENGNGTPHRKGSTDEPGERFMNAIEERVQAWGAEEVIFDDGGDWDSENNEEAHQHIDGDRDDGRAAAVRVMDGLRHDGDIFDAVLDTIGGKDVREAAERLLRGTAAMSAGNSANASKADMSTPPQPPAPTHPLRSLSVLSSKSRFRAKPQKRRGMGHFTTLVGDAPDRPVPTAGDHFRAGLRSLRFGGGKGPADAAIDTAVVANSNTTPTASKVGYAWVSAAQDVDWEGDDIHETISAVLRMALDDGVRPWVGEDVYTPPRAGSGQVRRVPFERTPDVFVDDGPLAHGATTVVKVAAA